MVESDYSGLKVAPSPLPAGGVVPLGWVEPPGELSSWLLLGAPEPAPLGAP